MPCNAPSPKKLNLQTKLKPKLVQKIKKNTQNETENQCNLPRAVVVFGWWFKMNSSKIQHINQTGKCKNSLNMFHKNVSPSNNPQGNQFSLPKSK